MPAPAPARGSSTCFPRRPTTASCRPSLSASARQQRRSRSCRRTRRAVTFGPMALVEVMLKMAPPAPLPLAYDTLTGALDALAVAPPDAIDAAGVRGMWLLLGVLGFEPSLATCVRDGAAIVDGTDPVAFSVADGGVACSNCTPSPPLSRLPRQAYRDLLALNDARADLPRLDAPHAAAHRRLVPRFLPPHFPETGALSALDFWERHAWTPTPSTPAPS